MDAITSASPAQRVRSSMLLQGLAYSPRSLHAIDHEDRVCRKTVVAVLSYSQRLVRMTFYVEEVCGGRPAQIPRGRKRIFLDEYFEEQQVLT